MLLTQSLPFCIFAMLACLAFPFGALERIGKFYSTTWAVFIMWTAAYAFAPYAGAIPLGPGHHMTKVNAGQLLFLLCMIPPAALALYDNKKIWWALKIFMLIDMAYLIYAKQTGSTPLGLVNADTFDATIAFICALHNVVYGFRTTAQRIYSLLMVGAAWYLGGETVALCAALSVAAIIFYQLRANRAPKIILELFCLTVLVVLAAVSYAYYESRDGYVMRFDIWQRALTPMLTDYKLLLLGNGPGSYEWYGLTHPIRGHRFIIMHNDFLQVLYEYGALMAALFVSFILVTIYRLRDNPAYFVLSIAYTVCMVPYFPLHFFPSLAIGVLIVAQVEPPTKFAPPDPRYAL